MGFGLLFIGYLFLFSFPYKSFDIAPDLIGFIISYLGIRKLSEYGCGFDNLKKYFYILLPAGFLTLVLQLLSLFGIDVTILNLWSYVYIALLFVYNILLLTSIYKIAKDTDLRSIMAKSKRNLYIGVIYYALMLFFEFPVKFVRNIKDFLVADYSLGFILFVMGYLWLILNLIIIYNCYMWICEPGDEDMQIENKKSFKLTKKEK